MSSYFPYNEDEWEKIVEQAFAADAAEPQFSKAYQRRKHRMERKMMRTRCSAKKESRHFSRCGSCRRAEHCNRCSGSGFVRCC